MGEQRHQGRPPAPGLMQAPKVVSIVSGKGGVGKTVLACNLADRMADLGYRVLLVDADVDCGNAHILLNVRIKGGLDQFAAAQASLRESVTKVRDRLDLVTTQAGGAAPILADAPGANALIERLRKQALMYDLILIDHAPGRSRGAVAVACASELNVIVVVPELTSLADGYGLYKHLRLQDGRVKGGLVINRVESPEDDEFVRVNLAMLTERYLGQALPYLGSIPEDRAVKESVAGQQVLASRWIDSRAEQAIVLLGVELVNTLASYPEPTVIDRVQINRNQALADMRE